MNKSESIANLVKAMLKVMFAVQNIEKNMTVGSYGNTYKGVADKDVKLAISAAMIEAGLTIAPITIEPKIKIERWEESGKIKQSVFTEVNSSYLLMHESGEFIELQGYGHGVDTQDKSAGKATTYALKNTLLYTFLIATGSIDDTDNHHSDSFYTPKSTQKPVQQDTPQKPWLNENTEQFDKVVKAMKDGYTIDKIRQKYNVSKKVESLLNEALNTPA